VGDYHNAERTGFQTGRAPGLNVYGEGRGCNNVYGSFSIDQLVADGAGTITQLQMSFVQHCETPAAPAMRGVADWNMQPVSFRYGSQAGDYVGNGDSIGVGDSNTYSGDTSIFTLVSGPSLAFRFTVSGKRDTWEVNLGPAQGQTLQVGEYLGASSNGGNVPYISVSSDGRGCSIYTGDFTVLALATGSTGHITNLKATFSQQCDGSRAVLHGTIDYFA
jgi:hypothetical protein